MIIRIIVFLVINFAALAIGGLFTSKGVPSDWYLQLNKAPWSPPGWMFGAAWTLIMILFSIFMAKAWEIASMRNFLIVLFIIQLILNISWNPLFFKYHLVLISLIDIGLLTLLMLYFLVSFYSKINLYSLLLLPYVIWLFIATSLNAYIFIKN